MVARMTGPVASTVIDTLYGVGAKFLGADPDRPCRECGCRFGSHQAVLPLEVALRGDVRDAAGTVECEACDRVCGTWALNAFC